MNSRKILSSLLLVGVFLMGSSMPVQADGVIMPPDEYYPVYETEQKALILYKEGHEDLVISISFNGNVSNFGWVIPVPNQPEISKVDSSLFTELAEFTRPKQNLLEKLRGESGYSSSYNKGSFGTLSMDAGRAESTVEVIEEDSIGIFDYAVLKAGDPEDLRDWMDENDYRLPSADSDFDEGNDPLEPNLTELSPTEVEELVMQMPRRSNSRKQSQLWSDALPVFQDYIDSEWYFVTVKVSNKFRSSSGVETQLESGSVDPLRFSFDTTDMVYPMKLTALGQRDLSVQLFVIDDHKVRVKNYNYDYCLEDAEDCSYFSTEYAGKIKKQEIEDLTKEIGRGSWYEAEKDMYITQLYCSSLPYTQMQEEVLFKDTAKNQGVNDGSMSLFEWIQLPFVFLVSLPYLLLGGFASLFGGSYYLGYEFEGALFVIIGGILFVGSAGWIALSTWILKKMTKRKKRVLLYCLQFPSVWFVSLVLSLVVAVPCGFLIEMLGMGEEVIMLDIVCIFSFVIMLLPLMFYRRLWRRRLRRGNSGE